MRCDLGTWAPNPSVGCAREKRSVFGTTVASLSIDPLLIILPTTQAHSNDRLLGFLSSAAQLAARFHIDSWYVGDMHHRAIHHRS